MAEKEVQGLLAECGKDPALRSQLFGPCQGGGKGQSQSADGFNTMLDRLFDMVRSRLTTRIQDIFKNQTNNTYFDGKGQGTVIKQAGKEAGKLQSDIASDHKKAADNRTLRQSNPRNPLVLALEQLCSTPPPPVNTPPKADAGGPYIITLPLAEVTLNGSKSSDAEKNIAKYNWKTMPGRSGPNPLDPNQVMTRVTGLKAGEYWYLLTVTDSYGATGYDTAFVTVKPAPPPPPQAPVAKVDPVADIILPLSTVNLAGTGTDPNKQGIVAYYWEFIGDSRGARIGTPAASTTPITGLKEGIYKLVFTVTNKAGLKGSATVSFRVRPRPNKNPTVSAGNDTTIQLPSTSTRLTGIVSDPDKDPYTIKWTQTGTGPRAGIDPSNVAVTSITGLQEGTYTFVLTAKDDHNGQTSDTVIVTVIPANKIKPVAHAGPDTTVKVNAMVTLNGSGDDADGRIVTYSWTQTSGPKVHIVSPDKAETRIDSLREPGEYKFELKVTDNDTLTGTDEVVIMVTNEKPVPWIWIIIGAVLLGAGGGWFLFGWWWRKRKLIVYFMNREEEILVRNLLPGHDKTEGYVVGHTSQARIRSFKKKGLALRVLNTEMLTVNTPGITRVYKFSSKKGKYVLKSETRDAPGKNFVNVLAGSEAAMQAPALPAYYIITLDAPLIPEFSQRLEDIGLTVLQRVPYNSYVLEVKEQWQLDKLQTEPFRFIRMARPYTAEDTGFTIRPENTAISAAAEVIAGPVPLTVDLVLHREEDKDELLASLRGEQAEVQFAYRHIVRVTISKDPALYQRLAANKYIQAIYEHVPPVLYNDFARQLIGIDSPLPEAFTETGEGQTVAVADTGIDINHPDLHGAVIQAVAWGRKNDDTSDPHGHGTHVAGTIAGNGQVSGGKVRGMAPGASLFFQSLLEEKGELCDLQDQLPALLQQAYDRGARIINISWGANTESYYTFDSIMIDEFVYKEQEMLVVVSAGNEAANQESVYGTVGSPATTKNGLTVGASNSKRDQGDAESVAAFSSRGPCKNDRRIKPDIVAPGTHILSTRSAAAPDRNFESFYEIDEYVFLGGTSMATPVVSGAAAMVREFYLKKKEYSTPSAALVKATLLNGTRRLTGTASMQGSDMIPNNNQGYGILDMLYTIPNKQNDFALWFADSLSNLQLVFNRAGEARFWQVQVKTKTWLRVCMVFTDNPRIGVQSDLNLIVSQEGTTNKWKGNAGINKGDQFYSRREADFTNNIEIVRIADAEAGSYRVEVVAENAAPKAQTGFALVITTGDLSSTFAAVQL